ncbi:hypothetical protein BO71DRAFT_398201 [Aspergillus ellipticus CBS 707.79]|uniref:Uncharacterized protein n=1 Tax=Aspergillus ellipticus CBS 707.79 TaxID=1448320 RepID=A0A319DM80_9EURO|nr:hypothetical protein BO71DRAFT_398201 [Aspergillus ellipticus CBS 707.79]
MSETQDADPDTRAEVDLMILDYLLCTAIELALYHGKAKSEGQHLNDYNLSWQFNTINSIRAVLLLPRPLPRDLQIKIQVLEFAQIFYGSFVFPEQDKMSGIKVSLDEEYRNEESEGTRVENQKHLPLSQQHTGEDTTLNSNTCPYFDMLLKLAALCNATDKMLPEDIVAHFILLTAWDEYPLEIRSLNRYKDLISRALDRLNETPYASAIQASSNYLNNFQLPVNSLLDTPTDTLLMESPRNTLEGLVSRFLAYLMKTLDPPVLIQIERGQLVGLSREETKRLKDRAGV